MCLDYAIRRAQADYAEESQSCHIATLQLTEHYYMAGNITWLKDEVSRKATSWKKMILYTELSRMEAQTIYK